MPKLLILDFPHTTRIVRAAQRLGFRAATAIYATEGLVVDAVTCVACGHALAPRARHQQREHAAAHRRHGLVRRVQR